MRDSSSLKPRSSPTTRANKASSSHSSKSTGGSGGKQSLLTSLLGLKKQGDGETNSNNDSNSSSSSSSSTKNNNSNKKITDPRSLLKRSHSAQSRLDTIGKAWLNAPIQRPAPTKKKSYDRFIPDRDSMDLESARYNIAKQTDQRFLDYDARSRNERVAAVVGITPNQRILSFKPEAPVLTRTRTDYTKLSTPSNTTTSPAPPTRRILTSPEKILDAPYMADDYYLNLLDWSVANVVAIGLDRSIYLWNANDGTIQTLNYQSNDPVASLSWSADGAFLAVGTCDGATEIWDVEANQRLRSMAGHQSRVGVLSWNKHLVSSGSRDSTIWHHDVRVAQHKVAELVGHQDEVCGLKWRSDGDMLASGGNDNTVNLWDARATTPKYSKSNHVGAIKAIAWCPWNTNLVATGGGREDKHIHFWNASSGARVRSVYTGSQVTSLIWSKHYKEIVSSHGFPDNQLIVWGYPKLNKITEIPGHDSRILHSVLSPDGQVVATAAADENLKFWRLFEHDGKELTIGDIRHYTALKRSNSLR
ncbi:WD40 repeat-like protein [Lichtheimia hyalospora FSU 10163]|nr:WD40 repeat-like protein [Lichtheimia hyalospora FSU 10163]